MSLIYLATPYSSPDPEIQEERFLAVNRVAAKLMSQGLHIYSPISHTHPIANAGDLPRGWDYWEQYDRAVLAACVGMMVFCQDGWRQSKGVSAEIEIAHEMGLPVQYINENGDIL